MRKNINKLATLVMTGALAASMSFAAFAEEVPATGATGESTEGQPAQEETTGTGSTRTLTKKVTTDAKNKTSAPQTTFNLAVTAGPTATSVNLKSGNDTYPYTVTPGTTTQAGNITVKGADFTGVKTPDVNGVYEANFTIEDKNTYTAPGVYSYTLKEVDGKYTGIKYDDTTYTMYVSVVNDGNNGEKVDTIVIAKADGTKIAEITNDFGSDNDNNNTTHDLTIKKAVTGNAGDLNKEFTFSVSVKPKDGTNVDSDKDGVIDIVAPTTQGFTLTSPGTNGTTTTPISANGEATTVKLKANQSLKIEGLTGDYDVYVTESEAGKDGYTTKLTTAEGVSFTRDSAKADTELKETSVIKVEATTDGANLIVTNHRENVTPTGVAMDVAPYALMVALAGGAAATFLRKKESFED